MKRLAARNLSALFGIGGTGCFYVADAGDQRVQKLEILDP